VHVNEPIRINLYFYFLNRMDVGSIKDLYEVSVSRCPASPFGRLESRCFMSTILSGPKVGVPAIEVVNTSVP
jgi:hypothetical protein